MNRKFNVLSSAVFLLVLLMSCESDSSDGGLMSNGQGGSMARFTIAGDYLFTVGTATMQLFDISQPENPINAGSINAGFNIETIFNYQSNLFLGSQDGMYIYDIERPSEPELLSIYHHITSCDPVVAQGNFAYVTMRNGVNCRFGQNLMDIIDISNPSAPKRISSTRMFNPHGLAIADTLLYVCEGKEGLKVLNVKDPHDVKEVAHIPDVFGYDVIVRGHLLILTGENGVFQYRVDEPDDPELLSEILTRKM